MNRLSRLALGHFPWLLAGLILTVLVIQEPAFQRPYYWQVLGRNYFATAALALALTPIILTGGIDLSVGSAAVLASVVVGVLWRDLGWPLGWALAGGVGAGLVAGLINGGLVVAGVMPLVATLATRELFRGLASTLCRDDPVTRFPPELTAFWTAPWFGLPFPLYLLGVLFILTYLAVHRTWVGRAVFAVGDNEQAARFAGVPVRGLKLGLYAWSGLVAGVCGAALVMQYGAAKPTAERWLELWAIACVVMGGVRVTGGAGSVPGTLLGTVTVVALLAGLQSAAPDWREAITGGLLVAVAVSNEAVARRLAARPSPA